MGKEKERKRKEEHGVDGDKKKKKRRRSSPSSSPDLPDESKSKKHRTLESTQETGKDNRDKKSKSRRDKSHNKKEKKSGEKHGSNRHKRGKHSKLKIQELSSSDYFSKNNEFATWLKEEKKLFFSDLSSEGARDLFSEFVAEWNDSKLDSRYYEGIATAPRTSHKWNIRV